jgi:signal transduction histidine kinase
MKHLLLIILFLSPLSLKAQSPKTIDSLKTVLSKLPTRQSSYQTDTTRVRILCAIADKCNNPDSTIKYAKQAKLVAKRLNWVDGEFESGFRVGWGLSQTNLYYQALDIYFGLLALTEKYHLIKREAIILRAIGNCYTYIPDYKLAKINFINSMNIFKNLKEYEEFADTQNNLAIVYTNDKQPQKAVPLLKNCLKFLPHIKGKWSEISFYLNLAVAYNYLNDYNSAQHYALKAVSKTKQLGHDNDVWKSQCMIITGFVYQRIGDYVNALNYAGIAKKCLPNEGKEDSDLNDLYYQTYKSKLDYQKSLYYLELFKKSEDKKIHLEQSQILVSLKSLYDLNKEQDKVLLLNSSLEKENFQKKVGFGGLIIISGFLVFAYWSFVNQKRKNKQIEEQRFAIQELNNSLENKVIARTQELSNANQTLIQKNQEISEALFKGQSIERTRVASALHDNIGGTITALKWMLESIDVKKLSEADRKIYKNALNIASEAYSDVRFMSHNFIPEVLSQLGLQGAVKKLCQEICETKRLEMSFEDYTFSEFSHQIELEVYSICLELTTNILKHSKATQAKILMQEDDLGLEIIVSDNGIGINNEDVNGKGLKNIHQRLEAIKGTIEVNSIFNEISCFTMRIPLVMTAEYMNPQA